MKLEFIRREFFPYTVDPCEADDIEDPICDNCGEEAEAGMLRGFGFILKAGLAGILVDPETLGVWTTAIAAGHVFMIKNARGSFDGGTPVYVDGFGDQIQRLIGYDYVAAAKDPVYKSNRNFWNSVKGRTDVYFFFRTETQTHISDKPVTIAPKNAVAEDLISQVIWEAEIKWRQKDLLTMFDTPATLYDCVFVPEYYIAT